MKPCRALIVAPCCLAILIASGCATRTEPAATLGPTLDELPDSRATERVLPIRVGVEDRHASRQPRIVPEFKPVEPTPEERRILGPEPEPVIDFLALYTPARPGIDPHTSGAATVGVGGVGGAFAGLAPARSPFASYMGLGGVSIGVDFATRVAGLSLLTPRASAGLEPDSRIKVGVDSPTSVAGRHDRVD